MLFNMSLEKLNKVGLVTFFLSHSMLAYAVGTNFGNAADNRGNSGFPQWPERAQEDRNIIPPPPPGPYTSSALNDYAVQRPAFKNRSNPTSRSGIGYSGPNVPIETFSPDIPWPDEVQPPRGGAQQSINNARPPVMGNFNQAKPYVMPPAQNKGFQPNINNVAPRQMPSMRFSPDGRNNYGYQSQPYGNGPSANRYSGYRQPANDYGQPTNPMNRSPYPAPNVQR